MKSNRAGESITMVHPNHTNLPISSRLTRKLTNPSTALESNIQRICLEPDLCLEKKQGPYHTNTY